MTASELLKANKLLFALFFLLQMTAAAGPSLNAHGLTQLINSAIPGRNADEFVACIGFIAASLLLPPAIGFVSQ